MLTKKSIISQRMYTKKDLTGNASLLTVTVMRKSFLLCVIVLALLIWSSTGLRVNFAKANPLPSIDPKITIVNPQNSTYYTSTITISIIVESNWGTYLSFYSLDEQEMVPIENMTVVSQEIINPASNLPVARTVLRGNCTLSNLSEGWHNVTFYLITDHDISLAKEYKKGDVLCSITDQFKIDTSWNLTTLLAIIASGAVMAVSGVGLLVYFKRHKKL